MESKEKTTFDTIYNANVEIVYKVALKYAQNHHTSHREHAHDDVVAMTCEACDAET